MLATLDVASEVARQGDSLLTVLREYFVDIHARLKVEARQGVGLGHDAIDDEMLD